jgi:hypothetical protein
MGMGYDITAFLEGRVKVGVIDVLEDKVLISNDCTIFIMIPLYVLPTWTPRSSDEHISTPNPHISTVESSSAHLDKLSPTISPPISTSVIPSPAKTE